MCTWRRGRRWQQGRNPFQGPRVASQESVPASLKVKGQKKLRRNIQEQDPDLAAFNEELPIYSCVYIACRCMYVCITCMNLFSLNIYFHLFYHICNIIMMYVHLSILKVHSVISQLNTLYFYSTHTAQSLLHTNCVCSAIPALPSLHLDHNLASKTPNLSAKIACVEGASCDGDT